MFFISGGEFCSKPKRGWADDKISEVKIQLSSTSELAGETSQDFVESNYPEFLNKFFKLSGVFFWRLSGEKFHHCDAGEIKLNGMAILQFD